MLRRLLLFPPKQLLHQLRPGPVLAILCEQYSLRRMSCRRFLSNCPLVITYAMPIRHVLPRRPGDVYTVQCRGCGCSAVQQALSALDVRHRQCGRFRLHRQRRSFLTSYCSTAAQRIPQHFVVILDRSLLDGGPIGLDHLVLLREEQHEKIGAKQKGSH